MKQASNLSKNTIKPFRCATTLRRHLGKCELRSPPGIEIYTDSPNNDEYTIAVYEIGTDGENA